MLFAVLGAMVEGGLGMARAALLERGLEQTVRELRIGGPISEVWLHRTLCDATLMPSDCETRLTVEVTSFDPETIEGPAVATPCRTHIAPPVTDQVGSGPRLMLVRACLLFDPIMPVAAMAAGFAPQPDGRIAIVARGAYAEETR